MAKSASLPTLRVPSRMTCNGHIPEEFVRETQHRFHKALRKQSKSTTRLPPVEAPNLSEQHNATLTDWADMLTKQPDAKSRSQPPPVRRDLASPARAVEDLGEPAGVPVEEIRKRAADLMRKQVVGVGVLPVKLFGADSFDRFRRASACNAVARCEHRKRSDRSYKCAVCEGAHTVRV